jgi:hypothetical protein
MNNQNENRILTFLQNLPENDNLNDLRNLPENDNLNDLRKIVDHGFGLIDKNKLFREQDDLYCIKNTDVINSGEWNDVHVIENLNKSFIFKKDILCYKKRIFATSATSDCFREIQDESKCITMDFLQSLLLFGKSDEMTQFRLVLTNILKSETNSKTQFYNCLRVYNILLYSTPFLFLTANTDADLIPLCTYAPFEYLSDEIYRLSLSIDYNHLPLYMKIQAGLENSLPEISYFRNVYSQYQTILLRLGIYYYRRKQIITVGALSTTRILLNPLLSHFLLADVANNAQIPDIDIPVIVGTSVSRDDALSRLDREIINLFTY